MSSEPETFDLKSLSAQTGVAPRTVHFYVQQGLLPPPDGAGRGARYTAVHRDRLRLIRRLQDQHLPLAEIRRHLDRIPDAMLGEVASSPAPPKPRSAADYIRSVLGSGTPAPASPPTRVFSKAPPAPGASPVLRAPMRPTASRLPDPDLDVFAEAAPLRDDLGFSRTTVDRSQWERLVIHPDVEIHLRRPGSRATNRKADKLVDFARSIFKEDA